MFKSRLAGVAGLCGAFTALLVGMSPGAHAAPTPRPAVSDSSLSAQYSSLSAALLSYYANASGQDLSAFLASTSGRTLSSAFGVQGLASASQTSQIATLSQLTAQLNTLGSGLGDGGFANLAAQAKRLDAHASSLDASVVRAGVAYTNQLAQLRMPSLAQPHVGSLASASAFAIPAGSLQFGLLLDRSLSALVTNHPNVFAQVGTSGLGSAAGQAAWNASLLAAEKAVNTPLSSTLSSPCAATLVSVMASGASAGSGGSCSPCVSAGMYLHTQISNIFNPGAASTVTPHKAGTFTLSELTKLPTAEQNAIMKANPGLVGQLSNQLQPAGSPGCSDYAQGESSALNATLPSLFANLSSQP